MLPSRLKRGHTDHTKINLENILISRACFPPTRIAAHTYVQASISSCTDELPWPRRCVDGPIKGVVAGCISARVLLCLDPRLITSLQQYNYLGPSRYSTVALTMNRILRWRRRMLTLLAHCLYRSRLRFWYPPVAVRAHTVGTR